MKGYVIGYNETEDGWDFEAPFRTVADAKEWATQNGITKYSISSLHTRATKEYFRDRNANIRAEFISAYGGKCTCCGESNPRFLTVQHTQKERLEGEPKGGGVNLYHFLKKMNWPKTHHTLWCFNCNCGSARNNYKCPHEEDEK